MQRPAALMCSIAMNIGACVAHAAAADTVTHSDVANRTCAAMAARVDGESAAGPVLLRSYDGADGSGPPAEPSQQSAAYIYDNALAVIALLACDKPRQALRIGSALRLAAHSGPRLRNAYRAGSVGAAPLANGWWDAQGNHWAEDSQQQGTATGNVAWAALALLDLYAATGQSDWRESAQRLAKWILAQTSDPRGAGGFVGGVEGDDAHARKVTWKSTEHNIDAAALFDRMAALEGGEWRHPADAARRFLASEWDAASGHFFVGTLDDGVTPNRTTSGLDAQLWPLLLAHAPADWARALAYVESAHRVDGGFDFNADRDGLWLEGTAQAALAYRVVGRADDAQPLLATIAKQIAPGGYVYATREPRITTGLALNAGSASADFYYYRRPHLGATAWAALAALGRNPFEPPRQASKRERLPK
ncbi:MAG TPA: hypothetical protein VLB69_13315 [Rudaea sp.]|nr:hypothetical protein [Rudaea sp.]